MNARSSTLCVVAILALAGAGLSETIALAVRFFLSGDTLPTTTLFRTFVPFWFPLAVSANVVGLIGGYLAIRRSELSNGWLTAFVVLFCFTCSVDNFPVRWIGLGYSIDVHFRSDGSELGIGVNVLGIMLVTLLWEVRSQVRAGRKVEPAGAA